MRKVTCALTKHGDASMLKKRANITHSDLGVRHILSTHILSFFFAYFNTSNVCFVYFLYWRVLCVCGAFGE
jgi:hypothetical protein